MQMARVKMNAKHEYEFLANYKVLQNFFKAKRIDKPVPVEKLVKCKMQYASPLHLPFLSHSDPRAETT